MHSVSNKFNGVTYVSKALKQSLYQNGQNLGDMEIFKRN